MSQEVVERVLGRLLTDSAFLQRAGHSLEVTCREAGYLLTAEELQAIRPEDLARLDVVSRQLDSSIRRFSRNLPGGGKP